MSRMKPRTTRGRFTKATPENTLGVTIYVCVDCHRMNPVAPHAPKPAECHACGSENLK